MGFIIEGVEYERKPFERELIGLTKVALGTENNPHTFYAGFSKMDDNLNYRIVVLGVVKDFKGEDVFLELRGHYKDEALYKFINSHKKLNGGVLE
jgi:hypothetical protein